MSYIIWPSPLRTVSKILLSWTVQLSFSLLSFMVSL